MKNVQRAPRLVPDTSPGGMIHAVFCVMLCLCSTLRKHRHQFYALAPLSLGMYGVPRWFAGGIGLLR